MRWLLLFAFVGCADDIHHEVPVDGAPQGSGSDSGSGTGSGSGAGSGGRVTTVRNTDGTYTSTVDSTSMTAWTNVDFETGAEVDATAAWDLRAQRFHISTNNAGGVKVAPLAQAFAATTAAPADDSLYVQDVDDMTFALDEGGGWYDYDPATHVLTPKVLTYVVKTDGGSTLALEILKYYDAAGTAGVFTWHWKPL